MLDLQAQYREIRGDVDDAVREVIESQRLVLGPAVERLEREISERVGSPHAVGFASGTDALLLSLKALGLEEGSEVVVPAFTFFATAGAVWNAGLKPVFADIDATSFNVTAESIERARTPRTRAVVVVHLFGQMADMDPILALARDRELAVIEDAAQSVDARQRIDGDWGAAGSLGTPAASRSSPPRTWGRSVMVGWLRREMRSWRSGSGS